MILDTSALLALMLSERDAEAVLAKIGEQTLLMSAGSKLEAFLVLRGRGFDNAEFEIEKSLNALGVNVVEFDNRQTQLAMEAFDRFGKGRHPAALNFGDCMTYALAKFSGQPIVYFGNDFAQTDLA